MATRTATIASSGGLHARPCSVFAQAVIATGLRVRIAKDGLPPVDARSILGLLTVGAKHGDTVELHAEGDRSGEHLDSLVELLQTDLDEV